MMVFFSLNGGLLHMLQHLYGLHFESSSEMLSKNEILIQYLGMQTASRNVCERMGRSKGLNKLQCDTVVGCPVSQVQSWNFHTIIPQSTVSNI